MKKIGVIIPTFSIEYAYDYLCGVYDFFKDKDARVVLAQTKLPHSTTCIYEYQYWCCTDLLKAEDIDALVVASGVYCASMKQQDLTELLRGYNKPVISAAIKIDLPNVHTIVADCKKAFYDVIKHLKDIHGCRKVAFMSANSTESAEALERYDAFLKAMKDNDLEFDSDLLFDGYFTDFGSRASLGKRIKSKADINFDAIVCANDMMAVGCYEVLQSVGADIPGDVKIVGFDDSQIASCSNPKLSTINQNIFRQGYDCAEYAYKAACGEKLDKIIYSNLQPKFRQSCGCIPLNTTETIFKDINLNICQEDRGKASRTTQYLDNLEEKNNIVTLMDMLKGTNTLRQLYYNIKFIVGQIGMSEMTINLYTEPLYLDSNEDFNLPETAEMYMMADREIDETVFRPDVMFNPAKTLFPNDKVREKKGIFILYPVFSGESNYGYLTCKIDNTKFADYNVYLKILVNSIAQAYEYTVKLVEAEKLASERDLLEKSNNNLSIQSKTDELTGILNRRGFFEFGQRTLDIVQEMNNAGIVFFADMDNLKKINDTYGHKMGDRAIKIQAQVLKRVFRSNDIVGRISGDEFGVVAPGMMVGQVPVVRAKIDEFCRQYSEKNKLPFTLSISVGYVDLESSTLLKKLMTEADKVLYQEKRIKHGAK